MRSPAANRNHAVGGRCRPGFVPFLTPTLALALAACGTDTGDAGDTGEMTIVDSAGVRIVEYGGTPDSAPHFRFSAAPVYRHGSRPGDYEFQYISSFAPRGGRFLPDGSAVIWDSGNMEVVLLGPDGALARILAGRGEGPGEVNSAMPLVLSQDSIVIHDIRNRRFTLFVDGAPTRTFGAYHTHNLRLLGSDGTGGMLMATNSYPASTSASGWTTGYLVRYDVVEAVVDTAGSYEGLHRSAGQFSNPFQAEGSMAAATGRFVTGRTDTPELTWRLPDGSPSQVLRWKPERAHPTREHLDQFVEYYRRGLMRQGVPEDLLREAVLRFQASYRLVPDEPLPLYRAVLADSEGRLWLEEYEPGNLHDGIVRHTVIAADGTWLATVNAPERFIFLDDDADRVLGMAVDELGVQHVVVYGLAPA